MEEKVKIEKPDRTDDFNVSMAFTKEEAMHMDEILESKIKNVKSAGEALKVLVDTEELTDRQRVIAAYGFGSTERMRRMMGIVLQAR